MKCHSFTQGRIKDDNNVKHNEKDINNRNQNPFLKGAASFMFVYIF